MLSHRTAEHRDRAGLWRTIRTGVLLVVPCGACSQEAPAPTSKPSLQAPARDLPAREPEARAFLSGRLRRLPPWGDELRKRIDPEKDGWPSEALAPILEARLSSAIERTLHPGQSEEGGPSALARASDAAFDGATDLCPRDPAALFDDGVLAVWRARVPALDVGAGSAKNADGAGGDRPQKELFDEQVARFRALFAGASDIRVEAKVEGIEDLDPDARRAHHRVRVVAARGRERLQVNALWTVDWNVAGKTGAAPTIVRIAVEGHELVLARSPVFAEVTRAVFGRNPFFADEILRGNDAYHLRQDRLVGEPFLGMHGIAIGDVDGDGLEDVYMAQPGGQPNRLFVHQPDGTARDVAWQAGVAFLDNTGPVLFVDLDNDGDQDLVVGVGSNLLIAWNDGHGRFTQGTVLKGRDGAEIYSVCAADPDLDGDLDLYCCRYIEGGVNGGVPTPYCDAKNGAGNLFWRNDGAHKFTECAAEVGLDQGNDRFSLAAIWEDFDEDGDPDLYVTNDFGRNNLYRNDGGHFVDVAEGSGAGQPSASMGASAADFDGDGHVDLYVTKMFSAAGCRIAPRAGFMPAHPEVRPLYAYHASGNTLLKGRGDGTFEDVTAKAGVARGGWGWGARFVDWNLDGFADIYVPDGFITNSKRADVESFFWRAVVGASPFRPPADEAYKNAWDMLRHITLYEGYSWNGSERKVAYANLADGTFADAAGALGVDYVEDARACAALDWDDDGRIDLLLRNRTGPRLRLLRNVHAQAGASVTLELVGTRCNRDAVGATAFVSAGGRVLRQTVYAGDGYLCGSSRRLVFGLGKAGVIDSVRVRWPGGDTEEFKGVVLRGRSRLVQGRGVAENIERRPHPALAALPAEEFVASPREVGRIVLLERMPMSPVGLPADDGPARRIAEFAGKALVVLLARDGDPASEAAWVDLDARVADLARTGVECWALRQANEEPKSPAAKEDRSWLGRSGRADKRFLQVLDVVFIELLGPYERLPLPLALVFDRAGRLCVVHCGPIDVARLAADLAAVHDLDPQALTTETLLGGRWSRIPHRDLEGTASVFELLGREDLVAFYRGQMRGGVK